MAATNHRTPRLNGAAHVGADLEEAIRAYVRTYAVLHGRPKAVEAFGVSRHTLWRFLEWGHMGRAVPSSVLSSVGGSVRAIERARQQLLIDLMGLRPDPALPPLHAPVLSTVKFGGPKEVVSFV